MKRLSIFFAALMACTLSFAQTTYEKVTAAPADWSGEYLLVYEKAGVAGAADTAWIWNGIDNPNNFTTATIADGKVSVDETATITLTITAMEGGYSILINGGEKSGQYAGGVSGSNKNSYATKAILNTFAIANGSAVITSNTSIMRFNAASNAARFRYYKAASASGQKPVQLYKKAAGAETPVAVESVALDKTEVSIEAGKTATLVATITPANATNKEVTWKSDAEAVATVADGVVTAVAEGKANITVTTKDGEKTATCAVTVTPAAAAVAVESVALDKAELSIEAGKTATLVATITPDNATNKNVTWATDNDKVATVANGVVTAVAEGKANITVTTEDGAKTATCAVTVTPVPAVDGMNYSVNLGTTAGYKTWTVDNKELSTGVTSVWSCDASRKYAKATAYVSGSNKAAEAWLVSPKLDLSKAEVAIMTINHALNFLKNNPNPLSVQGTKDGETWVELEVNGWPTTDSWTFVDATIDLTPVISANTQIAFVYKSTTKVAPTWEIKTVAIKGSAAVHATEIKLDKEALEVEQYKNVQLTATLTPAEATDIVEWASDNEKVATVSAAGVVTAVGIGTANITVTAGTVSAQCAVTVKEATPITCAKAVEIAKTVKTNNAVAEGGKYVIRGYVTALEGTPASDMKSYSNYSVWMADTKNGGKVFEAYQVKPVDGKTIAAVGDFVEVIGDITKYNSTYETMGKGTATIEILVPAPQMYTITAQVNDEAMGTVTGAGTFEENTEITLTATAKEGYKFMSWTVGEETNTENPLTITVIKDMTITANFAKDAATAIDGINADGIVVEKVVRDGQVLIVRDGKTYDMMGQMVE